MGLRWTLLRLTLDFSNLGVWSQGEISPRVGRRSMCRLGLCELRSMVSQKGLNKNIWIISQIAIISMVIKTCSENHFLSFSCFFFNLASSSSSSSIFSNSLMKSPCFFVSSESSGFGCAGFGYSFFYCSFLGSAFYCSFFFFSCYAFISASTWAAY